jgi:hypothetical protein
MEARLIEYCQRDYVSFAELEREFPELFGGDLAICFPDHPNLIIWQGLNQRGADLLLGLVKRKLLFVYPSYPLVYAIDGVLMTPVAKRIRNPKRPSWFPMVLCIHPPEYYEQKKMKVRCDSLPNGGGVINTLK